MKCTECGAELRPESKFCQACGAAVPVMPAEPKEEKKVKNLIPALAAACVLIILLAAAVIVLLLTGGAKGGKSEAAAANARGKAFAANDFEGKGFKSEEEAADALGKAFAANDLESMLSTFAIETYAENYDLEAHINRISSYMPYSGNTQIPSDCDYAGSLNTYARIGDITNKLRLQYIRLSGSDGSENLFVLKDFDDMDELLDAAIGSDRGEAVKEIEYMGTVSLKKLDAQAWERYSETKTKTVEKWVADYGAEELKSIALEFEIDGETWYMLPDLVRYGDRWYVADTFGAFAMVIGLDAFSGGIVSEDDM